MLNVFLLRNFVQMFRVTSVSSVACILLLTCITSGIALNCYVCDPCHASDDFHAQCSGYCKNITVIQGGVYMYDTTAYSDNSTVLCHYIFRS